MLRWISFYTVLVVVIASAAENSGDEEPFLREFTENEMRMSEQAGYSYVDRLAQLEEDLFAQGQYVKEDSPYYRMSQFKKPQPEAQDLSRKALLMLEAARFLKAQMSMTNEEAKVELRQSLNTTTTSKPKTTTTAKATTTATTKPTTTTTKPTTTTTKPTTTTTKPTTTTTKPTTTTTKPTTTTTKPTTTTTKPTTTTTKPTTTTTKPTTTTTIPKATTTTTSKPTSTISTTTTTTIRSTTASSSSSNTTCLPVTTCPTVSKYRAIDGSCNSLTLANLGKSFTDYRRLSSPAYADGIQAPRVASNGSALTSARLVSTIVFGIGNIPLNTTTLALMQFGQLINHDFESTTQYTFANGSDISCCSSTGGSLNASQLHPACLPVSVPTDDRFWNKNTSTTITTCMNFVRSISGPRLDCSIGYADQLNQNTHWLDASTVYGSTAATAATLRQYTGGLLLVTRDTVNNRDLLPMTSPCPTGACFYAGDSRATEQPQLTVMHTLWVREHNRVAKALAVVNPSWNDTILFEEARRIVIAEMQHITYNEFLPSLLSPATITNNSLAPLKTGYFTNTNPVSTGPISNEFATAAFRMGHSLVQGSVQLFAENGTLLPSSYTMSSTFNNASMLVNDKTYLDAVIRGLLTEPSQAVDKNVDDSLWNQLFKVGNIKFDIVALNIQRGRDHGLPNYNTYRQMCGFPKANNFSDLNVVSATNPVMANGIVPFLQQAYASIDDIDVYVGGLVELPQAGSVVGPTLNCLIGEQFKSNKFSDRYFYELGGQPHSFSAAQLTEIRKASLARIFCDNSDGTVLSVQPQAFSPVSATNARVLCTGTTIPSLNLTMWMNEALF